MGAAGMSEGQMWGLAGLRPRVVWHPELRRRGRRGGAALLVLGVLASAGAAGCLAGDGVSVGSCAHFVASVRTSEPSYAPGQPVIISVTQANDGPGCVTAPLTCGPPPAFASAYNSAGDDVWDYGASKAIPGNITCPPEPAPGQTWLAHYSDTQILDWSQDKCRDGAEPFQPGHANPDCPGTQVPAGTYRIVGGYWSYWSISDTLPSASATITISGLTSS
jgi:hypothetical protein